jgi:hypothetical protein
MKMDGSCSNMAYKLELEAILELRIFLNFSKSRAAFQFEVSHLTASYLSSHAVSARVAIESMKDLL